MIDPPEPPAPAGWRGAPRRLYGSYARYVAVSFVLFALGVVAGTLVVDLVSLSALFPGGGAFGRGGNGGLPQPTTGLLTVNNTVVIVVLVASGATLGLLTVLVLVYNGVIVGYVSVVAARAGGLAVPVIGILPHGVLEIPAFLFASAVAFRFSHQVLAAAVGQREDVMTRQEARDTALLVVVALVLIPIAAFVEAEITVRLIERFVDVDVSP